MLQICNPGNKKHHRNRSTLIIKRQLCREAIEVGMVELMHSLRADAVATQKKQTQAVTKPKDTRLSDSTARGGGGGGGEWAVRFGQ